MFVLLLDTSNLDIKKLAVIKKNKSEVAAESLNALMSAPILQNDEFSPSDLALVSMIVYNRFYGI